MKQGQYAPVPVEEQVVQIFAGTGLPDAGVSGMVDDIPVGDVQRFIDELIEYMRSRHANILDTLREIGDLPTSSPASSREGDRGVQEHLPERRRSRTSSMAGQLRELRKRIKSVQSTQKITKSFELIAASRIVRAERRVQRGAAVRRAAAAGDPRPRGDGGTGRPPDPADATTTVRRRYIVVTADRGLAGAYNANVLRLFERTRARHAERRHLRDRAEGARRVPVPQDRDGGRVVGFLRRARPTRTRSEIGERIVADFSEGKIGSVRIVFTEFESIMTQTATVDEILPLHAEEIEGGKELVGDVRVRAEPGRHPRRAAADVRRGAASSRRCSRRRRASTPRAGARCRRRRRTPTRSSRT